MTTIGPDEATRTLPTWRYVSGSLYKTELIDFDPSRTWRDAKEVETETASWIHWYNHQRLHSSIGDVPPIEYGQDYEAINTTRKAQ